jgi:hypothetical protein
VTGLCGWGFGRKGGDGATLAALRTYGFVERIEGEERDGNQDCRDFDAGSC